MDTQADTRSIYIDRVSVFRHLSSPQLHWAKHCRLREAFIKRSEPGRNWKDGRAERASQLRTSQGLSHDSDLYSSSFLLALQNSVVSGLWAVKLGQLSLSLSLSLSSPFLIRRGMTRVLYYERL
ncbi:hypothetical protein MPTK1_5g04740 [Marchantia polymorpha subsp. ruderalis]|uniref:Uncharacterized protein n=2 Tax=Marchantia polymorpha TaxID=3197 RepID=A0AAF6BEZ7_MARPO|nr:hypothetical protein MARPO_0027s0153 [Marchantia polymorpha]BBN10581.1 hypothetical protein Mp_5g04740 [Marchantia polymorpha subsp. ruderalis]|eukprot:PTQ43054.1 hypothetical protein MARPO_0027s0153 [Marchantia polymorpha]